MNARPIILAGIALLAGCGESEPAKPRQKVVVRGEEQNQLHQFDDLTRAIALKRAIHASGATCRRVDSSGYVAEYKNLSLWTAKCDNGTEWSIFVAPDGTAQVRRCKEHAQLGLPACVVRKDAAGPG